MMLAAELALARVDVAIVERRANQDLAGARAGGLHSRTIEVLDQRGVAERFLSQGKVMQVAGFAMNPLDISDFPTRHNYGLALRQESIEHIPAAWVDSRQVLVTDTVCVPERDWPQLHVISIAPLIADAMLRLVGDGSLDELR